MEENAKWQRKRAVDSILTVKQTKGFIIFINSNVVGEYKQQVKILVCSLHEQFK